MGSQIPVLAALSMIVNQLCLPGPLKAQAGPVTGAVNVAGDRCQGPTDSTRSTFEHAMRCAERFIAQQGFTTERTAVEGTRLVPGILEVGTRNEILSQRFGTLEHEAYAACPSGGEMGPGYAVIFRFTDPSRRHQGRLVTMSPEFGRIGILHREFPLVPFRPEAGCELGPAAVAR